MKGRPARSSGKTLPLSGVRAIVTDAETRLGLHVIRSLGRAGCRVTALANQASGPVIGFSSRYAAERIRLPQGDYWETLPAALEELGPEHDLLMPISAFSITVVATSRERIEPLIKLFIPELEAFKLASDKRSTTEAGRRSGVPIPETYGSPEPSEVVDWAEGLRDRLPLVVKFSDEERAEAWAPSERYRIVRSHQELAREYARMHEIAAYPLVQEYVDGDGFGFFTVMDPRGEPVGSFCHRRLREYPISGGPSTLCESYHDPALVETGIRLLKALDWRGVAMVEFNQYRSTGEYKLLEINPRFWGSLPLAMHCGMDFPLYQAQIALGMRPTPPAGYPIGRKMRFFFPDLLAVREEWRSGPKGKVFRRYLGELLDLSIKDGIFDVDDPRPLFTYLGEKAGR